MVQRYKATLLLMGMMILFAGSYSYRESFLGGLFNAGMLAAVIGGLADWYAVKALFSKPLGIGYRTAVIPRNRERIFRDVIEFISQDLLSHEHIVRILDRYSLTRFFLDYIEKSKGDEKMKQLVYQLVTLLIKEADKEQIACLIQSSLQAKVKEIQMIEPLVDALVKALEYDKEDEIIQKLLAELEVYVHNPAVCAVIEQVAAEIKNQYTGQEQMREMASRFLDLSEEKLAKMVQKEIVNFLHALQMRNHPLRVGLKVGCIEWLLRLKENPQVKERIVEFLDEAINAQLNVQGHIVEFLTDLLDKHKMQLKSFIDGVIDQKIDELRKSPKLQDTCEKWLKNSLISLVGNHHDLLRMKIGEKLANFSNEDLCELVEARVGNDLQMIRINGSVVGAIAGMVLYLITVGVERFVS